ncbi:DNA damage response protein RcaA [Pseudozyma hubeiensis SY62]|uniref:DNA damage response protein RcaA n=1 Tax=Pseudozyma hubeiensis (strain SY62) TaxID=1305764 RepID=R9P7P5_PSEHS|nr:DNA damage response protein RcaA [Pseudozyma hubeiensis SY62]GAC97277.1 DNA damage response protein RcaA [Pseudozyma hubeiensis SY62]
MWLLQGRFAEDSRQELSKVLKYGQTYTLGRKIPADIVIDSKFVSRTSCHITVASAESVTTLPADTSNPSAVHDDVDLRPRVTIRFEANKSRKTFGVTQQPSAPRRLSTSEPTEVQVPADQEHALQDGDSFALTTTISLRLVWKPISVCFAARVKETAISPLRKPAGELGIHLSSAKSRWRDGYTHLCLAQVKPTESVLCALLQARPIVAIDYFQELFRRAALPRHDPDSLETSFDELDLVAYQPSFDQQELSDVPDLQQKLLPQERRTYMLKGTTCVLFALPNEDSEVSIYKSILSVAGAHVFTHNPQAENLRTKADFAQLLMPYKNSALSYWRNSGSKARSEAPDEGLVVLVGAVHDNEAWKDACTVACTNLRIAMPTGFHAITNAIFSADVRAHLNVIPNMTDGQEEPEATAPAAAEVPAQTSTEAGTAADATEIEPLTTNVSPPPPPAAIPRNETSAANTMTREAEQAPAPSTEPSATSREPSRRPLTRRTRKPIQDVEEVAQDLAHAEHRLQDDTSMPNANHISSSQLTRAERSGLTRRTGASRANARRSDVFDALLRPDGSTAIDADAESGSFSVGSLADAAIGSSVPKSRRYRMNLDEEDRAQTQAPEASQARDAAPADDGAGHKRKSAQQKEASGITADADGLRSPASKRVRTGDADADQDDQPSAVQPHSQPTRIIRADPADNVSGLSNGAQPDSEPQFLQAINTQRAKGKKMDDFDVEFNRLQIAKPGTQSGSMDKFLGPRSGRVGREQQQQGSNEGAIDEDYEAFKQMAEEELRIHVRGNFVQVDFVPLLRKKVVHEELASRRGVGQDVPNFKKFRPKAATASSGTAAGPAASHARPRISLVLPESNDYGLGQAYWEEQQSGPSATSANAARGARSRTAARQIILSEDESETIGSSRSRGRTRVALDPASVEETAVDLGLDGLDSMDSEDEADMTRMLERRHGGRSQRPLARGKKRAATALVQDSDDEIESAGGSASRKRRGPAGRSSTTMLVDDDVGGDDSDDGEEDDDGNFAGFGRSTSTRRRRDPPATGTSRTRRSVF